MASVVARISQYIRCNAITFTDKKADTKQDTIKQELMKDIADIQRELSSARSHFDYQTNFDLIEADIYHINELETRYNHLIKVAKKNKIQAFGTV